MSHKFDWYRAIDSTKAPASIVLLINGVNLFALDQENPQAIPALLLFVLLGFPVLAWFIYSGLKKG